MGVRNGRHRGGPDLDLDQTLHFKCERLVMESVAAICIFPWCQINIIDDVLVISYSYFIVLFKNIKCCLSSGLVDVMYPSKLICHMQRRSESIATLIYVKIKIPKGLECLFLLWWAQISIPENKNVYLKILTSISCKLGISVV